MKLIVTIPCLNEEENLGDVIREVPRTIPGIDQVEVLIMNDGSTDRTVEVAKEAGADYVFSHPTNLGLAKTFRDALDRAIELGADIIVNTDGDNHYDQSRIGELITPILAGEADIAIGSRKIEELEGDMPFVNRWGNRIGSYITRTLSGLPKTIDVSTGFRAYTRDAAARINVFSGHTYTHATLISALDQKLTLKDVPIKARKVNRPSRLIPSIPDFIMKSGTVILRNLTIYKPLRVFVFMGLIFFLIGGAGLGRFLYFFFTDGGDGHIQSVVISAVLLVIGFQTILMGLIASAIGWNRKMLEELLSRERQHD